MDEAELEKVAGWLRNARYVTTLTGAGISTESGIPDFRGPQGVWTKNPAAEKTATLQYYMSDPAVRQLAWQNRVKSEMWTATPNAAHHALVGLERSDSLHALVTQNIDGLHHAAGQSPEIVIEIHGNVREAKCMSCDWRGPMEETLERVRAGEVDPECTSLRRDPEVGNDQLRREPRPRRPATVPGRGGPGRRLPRDRHVARRLSRRGAAGDRVAERGSSRDPQRRGDTVRRGRRRGHPGPAGPGPPGAGRPDLTVGNIRPLR